MDQPGDFGKTFAGAEQAQYFDLAGRQLRQRVLCERGSREGNALRHRRRQIDAPVADFPNRRNEVARISRLRDVTFGADLDLGSKGRTVRVVTLAFCLSTIERRRICARLSATDECSVAKTTLARPAQLAAGAPSYARPPY